MQIELLGTCGLWSPQKTNNDDLIQQGMQQIIDLTINELKENGCISKLTMSLFYFILKFLYFA